MREDYVIRELRRDRELAAFALFSSVAPTFAESDWTTIFEEGRAWRSIEASDLGGRVRGLAVFRLLMHPDAGYLMDVPIFVALSAVDPHQIAEHLFAHLQRQAAACRYMRVWNRPPGSLRDLESPEIFRRWDHGLIYRVPHGHRNLAANNN